MSKIVIGSPSDKKGITVTPSKIMFNANNVKKMMKGINVIWIAEPIALIPTMTSNTTPSGTVSASAETQPAYYAFDGNEDTYWYTYGNEGSYIQYKFEQARCVRKISVQTYYSGYNGLIKKFKVQASNDGSTFIDLTDTIINSNQSDKGKSEYTINNSEKYLYYRVYTVESGAYSGWRSIQMYGN